MLLLRKLLLLNLKISKTPCQHTTAKFLLMIWVYQSTEQSLMQISILRILRVTLSRFQDRTVQSLSELEIFRPTDTPYLMLWQVEL